MPVAQPAVGRIARRMANPSTDFNSAGRGERRVGTATSPPPTSRCPAAISPVSPNLIRKAGQNDKRGDPVVGVGRGQSGEPERGCPRQPCQLVYAVCEHPHREPETKQSHGDADRGRSRRHHLRREYACGREGERSGPESHRRRPPRRWCRCPRRPTLRRRPPQ